MERIYCETILEFIWRFFDVCITHMNTESLLQLLERSRVFWFSYSFPTTFFKTYALKFFLKTMFTSGTSVFSISWQNSLTIRISGGWPMKKWFSSHGLRWGQWYTNSSSWATNSIHPFQLNRSHWFCIITRCWYFHRKQIGSSSVVGSLCNFLKWDA